MTRFNLFRSSALILAALLLHSTLAMPSPQDSSVSTNVGSQDQNSSGQSQGNSNSIITTLSSTGSTPASTAPSLPSADSQPTTNGSTPTELDSIISQNPSAPCDPSQNSPPPPGSASSASFYTERYGLIGSELFSGGDSHGRSVCFPYVPANTTCIAPVDNGIANQLQQTRLTGCALNLYSQMDCQGVSVTANGNGVSGNYTWNTASVQLTSFDFSCS